MGGDGGQVFSSFRTADLPAPTGLHGTADRASSDAQRRASRHLPSRMT